jgi:hypothetical protein
MSDQTPQDSNLFTPGGTAAGAAMASAAASGSWRAKILRRLDECPSSTWELADYFGVGDNRISGRITGLSQDLYIEPTGERRRNPATNCEADVWRVRRAQPNDPRPIEQIIDATFPLTLRIDNDLYDRQASLPKESYPGVHYARRADSGGVRQAIRVELLDCPGCSGQLAYFEDNGAKKFRCMRPSCQHVWRIKMISEPGKAPTPALVMEEF